MPLNFQELYTGVCEARRVNIQHKKRGVNIPDYSEYAFIYDKDGNEYACPIGSLKGQVVPADKLTDEEKQKCMNMGEIVGTERI